jgi:hypothetical protein
MNPAGVFFGAPMPTRARFLRRAEGVEWPDLSDATLAAGAADWLGPALAGKTALAEARRTRSISVRTVVN